MARGVLLGSSEVTPLGGEGSRTGGLLGATYGLIRPQSGSSQRKPSRPSSGRRDDSGPWAATIKRFPDSHLRGEADGVPADVRILAEVLADVLAERGLVVTAHTTQTPRVLDAAQVADLLGRDRQWVYAHAEELGAFRYGDGPRARLGFDHATVERWKRERRALRPASQKPARRRRGSPADAGGGRT